MEFAEALYLIISSIYIVAGLALMNMGVQSYRETRKSAMMYLSMGFCLIVVAVMLTVVSALATGFQDGRSLLLVQNGISTLGFLFVVYSVIIYP